MHGAREQAAHLEADDGDHRQPGVAHDVAVVDPLLGQALGASGSHVVLVGDVEHGGPRDPRDDRERDRAQRDGGQDQVLDPVPERRQVAVEERVDEHEVGVVLDAEAWVEAAGGRQDLELHREDVLRASGRARRSGSRRRAGEMTVTAPSPRPWTCRAAKRPSGIPRPTAKISAATVSSTVPGKRRKNSSTIGPVVDDALAEVALEQSAHVVEVLLPQRLVEAELLPDLDDELRGRVLAEERRRRVAAGAGG